jgi:hypothetical protein
MFQYACARALTLELQFKLKLSIDLFSEYNLHHGYELERVFGIHADIATKNDIRHMIGIVRSIKKMRKYLVKPLFNPLAGRHFIFEPYFTYWPDLISRAMQGGYMQGYWQSELYFTKYIDVIRSDFRFHSHLEGKNAEIAKLIHQSNAVSVHVRRGDYVSNSKILATHGTCSLEYYFSAIAIMMARIQNAKLFVFSDDPQWVFQELQPQYPDMVLVEYNTGLESYNDMRLMSLCRHHIIANSSFSWWGAWLNPDPQKMVIAPAKWFSNGIDTKDLIPDTWEKI